MGSGGLAQAIPIPSKLIKNYGILYSLSRGMTGLDHTVGQSQQEGNQAMLPKGNTMYLKDITDGAHSSLKTNNHKPVGSFGFSGSEATAPPRSWPQAFPSIFVVLEKELFSFPIHQVLREKGPHALALSHYWLCQASTWLWEGQGLFHLSGPHWKPELIRSVLNSLMLSPFSSIYLFPGCISFEFGALICHLLGWVSLLAFRVMSEQDWLVSMSSFFLLDGFIPYWSLPYWQCWIVLEKVEMPGG